MSIEAMKQASALICSARLCEVNSMSSRQEMLRLMIEATDILRAAIEQATRKQSLQVPPEVVDSLTTTDIAWLATHRLTNLWIELGQTRWAGADKGWDLAIDAVRNRINDECQSVLDWKAQADQSQATAIELLQKMQSLENGQ